MNRDTSGKGRRPGAVRPKVRPSWRRDETGAVAVITGLCLMVFMMLLALVLDIGHIMAVRSELQNAADASALAGARELLRQDPGAKRVTSFIGNPHCAAAVTAAGTLTNLTDHQNIAIAGADIQLGHWGWPGEAFPLYQFVPLGACSLAVNAVQVTTRKDGSQNQPVATWFARVFGIDTVNVTSRPAVAAVGFINGAVAGRVFPIAIQLAWLNRVLGQPIPQGGIQFNPDGGDNGGWAGPLDTQPTPHLLKGWIDNGWSEQITIGNEISLNNGVLDGTATYVGGKLLSQTQNYTLGNGTSYSGWLVMAPVIDKDKVNQKTEVVAYQAMIITSVDAKGSPKNIFVVFYDRPVLVDGGLPGGPFTPGTQLLANIPRLVQ